MQKTFGKRGTVADAIDLTYANRAYKAAAALATVAEWTGRNAPMSRDLASVAERLAGEKIPPMTQH